MSRQINALAPWFGGKRTMAPMIAAQLAAPGIKRVWVLFAGSMAVELALPPEVKVVTNDKHSDIINLASVISNPVAGPKLYRRLRRTPFSQEVYEGAKDIEANYHDYGQLERAYAYFIVAWMGMNGFSGTAKEFDKPFAVRYTSNGGDPAKRFKTAVESIREWSRRMRDWTILNGCGVQMAEKIEDKEGTAIYADPDYLKEGEVYKHSLSRLGETKEAGHQRLAAALNRFKQTRVVVSYYADDRLADLYPGWNVMEVDTGKQLSQASRRDEKGKTKAPEVLLCNQPFIQPKAEDSSQ